MISILVVDDLPENIRLVRKLLSPQGFRVLEATNAEEALAAASEEMPDILLVDLRLGAETMTGYELARRIRKLRGGDQAVVLALSGGAVLDDDAMSRATGFDGFILKPFDFGGFADVLKDYLARK